MAVSYPMKDYVDEAFNFNSTFAICMLSYAGMDLGTLAIIEGFIKMNVDITKDNTPEYEKHEIIWKEFYMSSWQAWGLKLFSEYLHCKNEKEGEMLMVRSENCLRFSRRWGPFQAFSFEYVLTNPQMLWRNPGWQTFCEIFLSDPIRTKTIKSDINVNQILKISFPFQRRAAVSAIGYDMPPTRFELISERTRSTKIIKFLVDHIQILNCLLRLIPENALNLLSYKTEKIARLYQKQYYLKKRLDDYETFITKLVENNQEMDEENEKMKKQLIEINSHQETRETKFKEELEKIHLQKDQELYLANEEIERLNKDAENINLQKNQELYLANEKIKRLEKENEELKLATKLVAQADVEAIKIKSDEDNDDDNYKSVKVHIPIFAISKEIDRTNELLEENKKTIEHLSKTIKEKINSKLFKKIANRHVVIQLVDLTNYIIEEMRKLENVRKTHEEFYARVFQEAELELNYFQAEMNVASTSLEKKIK